MDIQPPQPQQPIEPVQQQQPQQAPVTPPTPTISKPMIIAIVAIVLLLIGVLVGIARIKPQQTVVAPTPTPTPPLATPTPIRQESALAGTQEFQTFQASVATLSAAIAQYNPQDPSLTPPSLVLPLGFSQ